MDAPRVSMGRWPTSVYTGPGDTRSSRPWAPITRVSSSHPSPDIRLTMLAMRLPVLGILCREGLVLDDQQVLRILGLGRLREVEASRDDGFAVDDHHLVVRDRMLGVDQRRHSLVREEV